MKYPCDALIETSTPRTVNAAIGMMVTAPMFFLIMPLYVGVVTEALHLTPLQVGMLLSGELGAAACISVAALFWIGRLNLRTAAVLCGGGLMIMNAACAVFLPPFSVLLILRMMTGLFSGALVSIAVAVLGTSTNPDRTFAYAIVGQLILSGLFLVLLPPMIRIWETSALFFVLVVSAAPIPYCGLLLPRNSTHRDQITLGGGITLKPFWGLGGVAIFFAAQSSFWAFIERIGAAGGLSEHYIGFTLGIASFLAVTGGLLAAWKGTPFNRLRLMIICAVGQMMCLLILAYKCNHLSYAISVTAYQIFWCLWLPLQLGVIAEADPSGRLIVLVTPFQAVGIALGPALVSLFIEGNNYIAVSIGGSLFALASVSMFLPLTVQKTALVSGRCSHAPQKDTPCK